MAALAAACTALAAVIRAINASTWADAASKTSGVTSRKVMAGFPFLVGMHPRCPTLDAGQTAATGPVVGNGFTVTRRRPPPDTLFYRGLSAGRASCTWPSLSLWVAIR